MVRDPRKVFLLAWVVWGMVFFSMAANKLPAYILPLLPASEFADPGHHLSYQLVFFLLSLSLRSTFLLLAEKDRASGPRFP